MAGSPFFWTTKDGWYLWTRDAAGKRKRVFLAKTKTAAHKKWRAGLAAGESLSSNDLLFSDVAGKWLVRQTQRRKQGEVSAVWLSRVTRTIESFTVKNPTLRCSKLTPSVARAWLGEDVSTAYEHTECSVLKQILRWACREEKLITDSPLESMKLSKGNRRDVLLSIDDHRTLVHAAPLPEVRALLWFAWWTGARPSELRSLCWEDLSSDFSFARLREHKNAKKSGKPRVIYFAKNAASVLRNNAGTGHVFVNSKGNPWTKDTLVGWLRKLRKATGKDGTAYAYRHSYITRALEQGVAAADVAAIVGTSVQMIDRNYGHLEKSQDRLKSIAGVIN